MKIEGITIQIIAGPYVYPENDEDPAFIDPVFIERGEINILDANYVPVSEIIKQAEMMALKLQNNHIKSAKGRKHGNKRNRSDQC